MPFMARISSRTFISFLPGAPAAKLRKAPSVNCSVDGRKEHAPQAADRPPGAPSASPAIADKAEKQQRGGEGAHGLARESGAEGTNVRARRHESAYTRVAYRGQVGDGA